MTSHKNWRREKTAIVERYLPAAVLWDVARQRNITHATLGKGLGTSSYPVQAALAGRSNLTWDRAFWLARLVMLNRQELVQRVDELEQRLAHELDGFFIYKEFPHIPPPRDTRLVMAYHIQARLTGVGWEEIFAPEVITSGDFWRARQRCGFSRATAAKAFSVSEGTIAHWEKANLPRRRWAQAREVLGQYL